MTSWMTSLSASTQTSQLIPSDGHNSNLDNYGSERGTSYPTEKRKERNEALEEEEEARPPYLHVSNYFWRRSAQRSQALWQRGESHMYCSL